MNQSRRLLLASLLALPFVAPRAMGNVHRMTPETSANVFHEWLASRQVSLASMSAQQVVHESLSFFREVRCDGVASIDGDMLLYQWGVYNWGQGEYFEFDITRQFITNDGAGDDAISQLRITAFFDPSEALQRIKRGDRWCENVDQSEKFLNFILTSAAYDAVNQIRPQRVTAKWSLA